MGTSNIKICAICARFARIHKRAAAPWTCRRCGRKTCEHYCLSKQSNGTAICGKCRK